MASGLAERLLEGCLADLPGSGPIRVAKRGLSSAIALDCRPIRALESVSADALLILQDPITGAFGQISYADLPGIGAPTTTVNGKGGPEVELAPADLGLDATDAQAAAGIDTAKRPTVAQVPKVGFANPLVTASPAIFSAANLRQRNVHLFDSSAMSASITSGSVDNDNTAALQHLVNQASAADLPLTCPNGNVGATAGSGGAGYDRRHTPPIRRRRFSYRRPP